MSRKTRRHPDLGRSEILRAATEVFARNGFERTSMADIGATAGVSRGLPAYFFGSKENLYRASMEHAVQLVRSGVIDRSAEKLRGIQPADFAATFIDAYIEFLAAHPLEVRLLQWDLLQPIRDRRQPALQALFQEGVELVRNGFGGKERRRKDARL